MEKDKNRLRDDDLMKNLMQSSKLKASENLQYRIMHQIEAEQALKPKAIKSTKPVLRSVLSIAVVLYLVVMALVIGAYATGGMDMVKSTELIIPVVAVSALCSIYALVIVLDERRYKR